MILLRFETAPASAPRMLSTVVVLVVADGSAFSLVEGILHVLIVLKFVSHGTLGRSVAMMPMIPTVIERMRGHPPIQMQLLVAGCG